MIESSLSALSSESLRRGRVLGAFPMSRLCRLEDFPLSLTDLPALIVVRGPAQGLKRGGASS